MKAHNTGRGSVQLEAGKASESEARPSQLKSDGQKGLCFHCKLQNPEDCNFCTGCGNMMITSEAYEVMSYDSNPVIAPMGGDNPRILGKMDTPTSD